MASPYQVQEEGKEFYKDNEWPDNVENIQRRSPSFCLKAWLPFSIQTVITPSWTPSILGDIPRDLLLVPINSYFTARFALVSRNTKGGHRKTKKVRSLCRTTTMSPSIIVSLVPL